MGLIRAPQYHELPIQSSAPPGSSWGVFDRDGKKDIYGTLNFATPEAVLAAKEEIRTGQSVVLKHVSPVSAEDVPVLTQNDFDSLPLHLPHHSHRIGRRGLQHTFIPDVSDMRACDDDIHINTQSTSQWDGLMHYAHQSRREFYNAVPYDDTAIKRTNQILGIDRWSDRGGIVARGILVDFVRYAKKRSISYDPLGPFAISLSQIKEILQEEKVQPRQGDILVVRCGLSQYLRSSTPADRSPFDASHHVGVDPTPELLEWLWNQNFAAVAGDALAFEALPASDSTRMKLHEACLPGWGMPIGELLDLEALAEVTEKNQRWSFFLTVSPLNLEGGASTLANTVAIM